MEVGCEFFGMGMGMFGVGWMGNKDCWDTAWLQKYISWLYTRSI